MHDVGKTLITVATYNEIDNLPTLVDEIFRYAPDVDILVIDDNSPDGTGDWCDRRAQSDSRVHCLHRSGKLGLGSATIAGLKYALDHNYQFVVNVDADFSHHPRYLPQLLAGMTPTSGEPVDVMIGSRYVSGGRIEGWPFKRHLMSRAINLYSRWFLWLRPQDCSGAYRCYRTSLLSRLDFDTILSQGYSFQEEVLWRLQRLGARMGEIPITFVDRVQGQSKISLREAWLALMIIARLSCRNLLQNGHRTRDRNG